MKIRAALFNNRVPEIAAGALGLMSLLVMSGSIQEGQDSLRHGSALYLSIVSVEITCIAVILVILSKAAKRSLVKNGDRVLCTAFLFGDGEARGMFGVTTGRILQAHKTGFLVIGQDDAPSAISSLWMVTKILGEKNR